jgi:hypothetical protein
MNKDIHNLYSAYRTINEGVFDRVNSMNSATDTQLGNNSAKNIVNNLRSNQGRGADVSKLAYAKSSREMKPEFAEMMRDPSKRPQVGANKANELEQRYEQGINQIREKYKDVQRPSYSELIENRYRYAQDKNEKFFYGMTDDLRTGDKNQWDKMASGDTSRGLYTDVDTVGHHDISFEKSANDTMRNMLKLADAYYSGDVKQLSYLLGLIPDDEF